MFETFGKDLTKVVFIASLIFLFSWLTFEENPLVGTWEYIGIIGIEEDIPSNYYDIYVFEEDGTFVRSTPEQRWNGTFELMSDQVIITYDDDTSESLTIIFEEQKIYHNVSFYEYVKVKNSNRIVLD